MVKKKKYFMYFDVSFLQIISFSYACYAYASCALLAYACFYQPGPSCSKLTTSLVNDSLKFTSSDTQIC